MFYYKKPKFKDRLRNLTWDFFVHCSHWTASKENLTAVQALKGQLLVGGQTVTLWDLITKKSVASFTGHPSQIFQVQIVPGTDYFVSLASGDRHLKIW